MIKRLFVLVALLACIAFFSIAISQKTQRSSGQIIVENASEVDIVGMAIEFPLDHRRRPYVGGGIPSGAALKISVSSSCTEYFRLNVQVENEWISEIFGKPSADDRMLGREWKITLCPDGRLRGLGYDMPD